MSEDILQFHAACLPAYGRRLGVTKAHRLCLVPLDAANNDLVFIPFGSKVPFVFREAPSGYQSIGECYVHGIMHGEALSGSEEGEIVKIV